MWTDLLIRYKGQTITYDRIGNPLKYRDGFSFGWSGGRKLTTVNLNNGSVYMTGEYRYDDEGIRTYKSVNGNVTKYYLNGSTILSEETNYGGTTRRIDYVYDENDIIYGFYVDGKSYYYQKNLQGDVTGILDANGNLLVEYIYDAYGVPTTRYTGITSSLSDAEKQEIYILGSNNPFRYRGYYYDTETGFYYLNSRYYDPQTGRFINADGQLNQQDGIIGFNVFVYCINNPVNGFDPCGTCFHHWAIWKDCAQCAALKAEKKAQEAAQTIKYDVPLYKQGNLSLCWAFCETMMESYILGIKLTQKQAKARAIEIAQAYHGSTKKKDWNQGGWPSNLGKCVGGIGSIEELYNTLQDNGPVYAYYSDAKSAHIVIVTGVNLYRGVVYTNNPWGVRGTQSFKQFQNGFATRWYHFSSGKSTSGAIIYLMD